MAHDEMRKVVLGGEHDAESARDDDRPGSVPRAGRGRGRRRAVVVAALVAALAAAAVGQGARERDARLAATPGLLPPMSAAPRHLWSAPGGSRHLEAADGDLLLSGHLEDGEQRLVAHDAASGERLWQTALAQVPIGQSLGCGLLAGGDAAATTHVVCVLAAPRPAGVDIPGYGPGSEQRLVVLDARTGRMLRDRSLGLGFVAMTVHDTDVLLAAVARDGCGSSARTRSPGRALDLHERRSPAGSR